MGGGVLENNNNSKYNSNFNYNYNNNKPTLKNSQGYNNSQNLKEYKTSENINQNKKDIKNQNTLFINNKNKIFHLKHQPNVNFVSTSITKWGKSFNLNSQPPADFVSTPLTNGGKGGGISQSHPILTNDGKRLSAFSLIELSIVLIIMGLLVAGVTGGQSLIQSAKTRAIINEATGYKRAVNIFYAKNGRLPGDPDGTGRMGKYSCNYEDPCSGSTNASKSWEEMASEGIVEYDSDTSPSSFGKESKYMKNVIYRFTYADASNGLFDLDFEEGLGYTNIIDLTAKYSGYIPAYIVVGIEEKIDDKSLKTGNVRIDYLNCYKNIPEVEDGIRYGLEWSEGDMEAYDDLAKAKNGACGEVIFKLEL